MKTITVSGSSDDLIEIDGDIEREYTFQESGDRITTSDGTIIGVDYNDDGMWRLTIIENGNAEVSIREGTDVDSDYSDVVTITGELDLVAHAYVC